MIAVRDRQGDAAVQEIRTDPVPITVTSVVPEGADYTEPKDIAPPMSCRAGLADRALGGARRGSPPVAAAVLWWRRRRRRAMAARPQPAHLLALAELDRLQEAGLGDGERFEAFYVRLSAILRRYLGWRFGLRALMQTTEEFVAGLPGAERALTRVPYAAGHAARRLRSGQPRATGRSAATWRRRCGGCGSSSSAPATSGCWSIRRGAAAMRLADPQALLLLLLVPPLLWWVSRRRRRRSAIRRWASWRACRRRGPRACAAPCPGCARWS